MNTQTNEDNPAAQSLRAQSLRALAAAWHDEQYVATQENDGKSTFELLALLVPKTVQLRPPPEPTTQTTQTQPNK